MIRLSRKVRNHLACFTAASLVVVAGCSKKDETSTTNEQAEATKPGTIMLALDSAMGSIAFGDAAASLALVAEDYDADWTTNAWQKEHCKPVGGAVLDNQTDATRWGCLLAVKTDGPDTPRGGTARIVSLACSVDEALSAGNMVTDGEEHTFKMELNEKCWGKQFAKMAADYLPDQVNANGFAEVEATVTGHTTPPSSWSDAPEQWSAAYDILWKLDGETSRYQLLLKNDTDGMAASILREDSDKGVKEIFAMAITDNGDDTSTFRYEGRFPFAEHGDGSGYGSSHTRVVVTGPFADGAFTAITSGSGYEASMYGADGGTALQSGQIRTFVANEEGLGTKSFSLSVDGSLSSAGNGEWEGTGDSPNDYSYSGSAAEKASVLTPEVADFSDGAAWHKANGPLSYSKAEISD